MNKKADIWISAVIYIGLAITILTIVLAAGMPVINKLRDKNIEIQTRDVMSSLDDTIRTVVKEGPGSRRPIKLDIGRGNFIIDEQGSTITWNLESTYLESEPSVVFREGHLSIWTESTPVQETYNIYLQLNYTSLINLTTDITTISGPYDILITNLGGETLPNIHISEV